MANHIQVLEDFIANNLKQTQLWVKVHLKLWRSLSASKFQLCALFFLMLTSLNLTLDLKTCYKLLVFLEDLSWFEFSRPSLRERWVRNKTGVLMHKRGKNHLALEWNCHRTLWLWMLILNRTQVAYWKFFNWENSFILSDWKNLTKNVPFCWFNLIPGIQNMTEAYSVKIANIVSATNPKSISDGRMTWSRG